MRRGVVKIEFSDFKVWVMGLVISCPYDIESCNCPLKDIRTLPLADRVEMVGKMSEQELVATVDYHKICFNKREKEGDR